MSVCEENMLSQQYVLKTCQYENFKNFLELTQDNVARVEAMIQMDSSYAQTGNIDAAPYKRSNGTIYNGSTAYWMTQMKDILVDGYAFSRDNHCLAQVFKKAIIAVDSDNSSHLNVGNGRSLFYDNLIRVYSTGQFVKLLKLKNNKSKAAIIKSLNPEVPVMAQRKNGQSYSYNRTNYSFTTKFCHYACYYMFEGQPEQDNYSIYDNVLGNALVHYAKHYGISNQGNDYTFKNFDDYGVYSNVIDQIRKKAEEETGYLISRNGFDHLLWYYHKGHPIKEK